MAWYNPLNWPAAITSAGYTAAGYVVSPFSSDTANFMHTAAAVGSGGDYTPDVFKARTDTMGIEQREEHKNELNRYTANVVDHIAPNTEIAATLTAVTVGTIATGGTLAALAPAAGTTGTVVAGGGTAATATGMAAYLPSFLIPTVNGVVSSVAVPLATEIGTDMMLARQGEAPTMKLEHQIPIIGKLGDAHYAAGGTPDTHPDRLAYLQRKNAGTALQDASLTPTEPSSGTGNPLGRNTDTAFDFWPLIIAAGGIALILVPVVGPFLGAGVLGGIALNQYLRHTSTDTEQSAPAENTETAQVKPNHPRSNGDDPYASIVQSNVPQNTSAKMNLARQG